MIEMAKLRDVQFWQTLCPEMTITEQLSLAETSTFGEGNQLDQDHWAQCKESIQTDAYFVYDSYFPIGFTDRLAACMKQVDEAGLPPVFCFVFDEFWELLLQLDPMLQDLLNDYDILPAVWGWFVKPEQQTAFAPHRDGVRDVATDDEEHLDYLTIWVPLTDLNHRSSCISVLPASCDADYDKGTDKIRITDQQEVRSLQAKRGSVMCWTIGLAHWGTKQIDPENPRMSVGYFVQNADADCLVPPPIDLTEPLPIERRLAIIGQQILDYARDERQETLQMAEHLVAMNS